MRIFTLFCFLLGFHSFISAQNRNQEFEQLLQVFSEFKLEKKIACKPLKKSKWLEIDAKLGETFLKEQVSGKSINRYFALGKLPLAKGGYLLVYACEYSESAGELSYLLKTFDKQASEQARALSTQIRLGQSSAGKGSFFKITEDSGYLIHIKNSASISYRKLRNDGSEEFFDLD